MGGLLLGVAFLMAVLAAASKARAATVPGAGPGLEDSVRKIVASGDPKKIAEAADAANKGGNRQLGDELQARARDAAVMDPHSIFPSPFPSVPAGVWTVFVRKMMGKNPREVTPANYLGLFSFGMRRLVDLGLATGAHQVTKDGKKVWDAHWIPPASLEVFLSSPALQYRTFVKACQQDLAAIKEKLPHAVGTPIDSTAATPSGLLAVAKQAGIAGLEKWIADEETRKKYPHTTAAFHAFNGMF